MTDSISSSLPTAASPPQICMICEDKATGLHYGIITCEGCKGFFKRTVQNKRVYTCVAEGKCVITKQQRNRCQYCRFQKCLRQGMVLAAVREDRMPGGRNSGAVYNLYKVKYKKHKKQDNTKANGLSVSNSNVSSNMSLNTNPNSSSSNYLSGSGLTGSSSLSSVAPSPLINNLATNMGILKSALTAPYPINNNNLNSYSNSSNNNHSLILFNCNQISKNSSLFNSNEMKKENQPITKEINELVRQLILVDDFNEMMDDLSLGDSETNIEEDEIKIKNEEEDEGVGEEEELNDRDDKRKVKKLIMSIGSREVDDVKDKKDDELTLNDKLCSIGDTIVYKLVQWTKKLPFYGLLPVHCHTMVSNRLDSIIFSFFFLFLSFPFLFLPCSFFF